MTQMEQFIRDYSASIGLSPDIVMRVVLSEGGPQSLEPAGYARQALGTESYGREESYGPFHMHVRGGLGERAIRAGYDPRDPNQAFEVAKFAMDTMKNEGLGAWHGWKGDPWAAHTGKSGGPTPKTPGVTMSGPPMALAGIGSPVGGIDTSRAVAGGIGGFDGPAVASAEPAAPATFTDKLKSLFTPEKEGEGSPFGAIGDFASALTGRGGDEQQADPISNSSSNLMASSDDAGRMQAAQALMASLMANKRKMRGVGIDSIPRGVV